MVVDEYKKETSYLKIYSSQRISALTKENKDLADKVKALQNVESAIEIKFIDKIKIDTVFVDTTIKDTIGIYHFESTDDTLTYKLDINADKLYWYKIDMDVNRKFTIINQESNGLNKLEVKGDKGVDITDVDAYHRREDSEKWYKHFYYGPNIGIGYGVVNHKPDMFIGFSFGYNLKK